MPGIDLAPAIATATDDDNALLKSQIKSEILEELADLLVDRRRGNNSHRGNRRRGSANKRRRSTLGNLSGGGQADSLEAMPHAAPDVYDDDDDVVFDVNDTAEMKALPLPS